MGFSRLEYWSGVPLPSPPNQQSQGGAGRTGLPLGPRRAHSCPLCPPEAPGGQMFKLNGAGACQGCGGLSQPGEQVQQTPLPWAASGHHLVHLRDIPALKLSCTINVRILGFSGPAHFITANGRFGSSPSSPPISLHSGLMIRAHPSSLHSA